MGIFLFPFFCLTWCIHLTSGGFPTPPLTPQDGPEVSVRPNSGVSARLNSGTKEKGGRRDLQIKVSARPYHLLQGPKPDLVIGESLGFRDRSMGKGREKETMEASISLLSLGRI